MYDFSAFDDFRVSAWLSDGLMTKATNAINTVTTSVKSAGMVVATVVTLATSPLAVAKIGTDAPQTVMVSTAKMSGPDFEQAFSRLSAENAKTLKSLGARSDEFDALTLDSADRALARIHERGVKFSQAWLAKMQSI